MVDGVAVMGNRAGVVTGSKCVPGMLVSSGESVTELDGLPLVGLATTKPLWRDLVVGDRGADVAALSTELARLGLLGSTGDRVTRDTVKAFSAMMEALGMASPNAYRDLIARDLTVWLPAVEIEVGECSVSTGMSVLAGDTLWVSASHAESARVVSPPSDVLPGDRIVRVGAVTVASRRDGVIANPGALSVPEVMAQAQALPEGGYEFTAVFALARPVEVFVVPPSAVRGLEGDYGCVDSEGREIAVRVVGSELGQTFLRLDEANPSLISVRSKADQSKRCVPG
jgi:hypothetical protein